MCGIYFSYSDRRFPQSEKEVNLSMQKIKPRGPDASGVSVFPLEDAFVALGHRRLSILDLNERSNQPFHSERYALTYNGEIYNHLEIRENILKDFRLKYDLKAQSQSTGSKVINISNNLNLLSKKIFKVNKKKYENYKSIYMISNKNKKNNPNYQIIRNLINKL